MLDGIVDRNVDPEVFRQLGLARKEETPDPSEPKAAGVREHPSRP